AVGEGRGNDGWRYAEAGLVMGVAIGLLAWVEARDVSPGLRLMKMDPATIPYARDFLAARPYGAPALRLMTAPLQHRQAIGDTRTPMVIGVAANVFNAVLAWALIHGHWGLPVMGVKGAGYGTACAEWGECIFLLALMFRDRRTIDLGTRPPLLKAM